MGEENKGNFQLMIDEVEINNISELTFDASDYIDTVDGKYFDQFRHFISSMIGPELTFTGTMDFLVIGKTRRKVFNLYNHAKSNRIRKKNYKRYIDMLI